MGIFNEDDFDGLEGFGNYSDFKNFEPGEIKKQSSKGGNNGGNNGGSKKILIVLGVLAIILIIAIISVVIIIQKNNLNSEEENTTTRNVVENTTKNTSLENTNINTNTDKDSNTNTNINTNTNTDKDEDRNKTNTNTNTNTKKNNTSKNNTSNKNENNTIDDDLISVKPNAIKRLKRVIKIEIPEDFENKEVSEENVYKFVYSTNDETDCVATIEIENKDDFDFDTPEDWINDVRDKNDIEDEFYNAEVNGLNWYIVGYENEGKIIYYNIAELNDEKLIYYEYIVDENAEDIEKANKYYQDIIFSISNSEE